MNIEKLLLSAYPETEDKEFIKKLSKIKNRISKLEELKSTLLKQCIHPQSFIKIKNRGGGSDDEYGTYHPGQDDFRVSCELCGKFGLGFLKPEFRGPNYIEKSMGSEPHLSNYLKAKEIEDLEAEKRAVAYQELLERDQLKRLKMKYGE